MGLKWALSEKHFRFHLIASFAVIIAGFYFKINETDWLFICFAISSVLASELINTAIEKLADKVEPNYNKEIGIIKDLAASAVLIFSITSIVIAYFVFWDKLMLLF